MLPLVLEQLTEDQKNQVQMFAMEKTYVVVVHYDSRDSD